MKKNILTAFAATALLFSCAKNADNPIVEISNFMPLEIENFWTYTSEVTDPQTNVPTQGTDSLYVVASVSSYHPYIDLDASAESIGPMTFIFSNTSALSENEQVSITGIYNLDLAAIGGATHQIAINDAMLLDSNVATGTILYNKNAVLTDIVTINGQEITLTINYEIETIQKEQLASLVVLGNSYTDILKADIVVSATIDATLEIIPGFPTTVNVAPTQEVYIVESYYANGVGLIQSDANLSVNFNTAVASQLGIPENMTAPSSQKINTYSTNK